MTKRSLRVAYVTTGSVSDIGNWSGLVKHIRDALVSDGHDVLDVEVLAPRVPLRTRVRGYWTGYVMRRRTATIGAWIWCAAWVPALRNSSTVAGWAVSSRHERTPSSCSAAVSLPPTEATSRFRVFWICTRTWRGSRKGRFVRATISRGVQSDGPPSSPRHRSGPHAAP